MARLLHARRPHERPAKAAAGGVCWGRGGERERDGYRRGGGNAVGRGGRGRGGQQVGRGSSTGGADVVAVELGGRRRRRGGEKVYFVAKRVSRPRLVPFFLSFVFFFVLVSFSASVYGVYIFC